MVDIPRIFFVHNAEFEKKGIFGQPLRVTVCICADA